MLGKVTINVRNHHSELVFTVTSNLPDTSTAQVNSPDDAIVDSITQALYGTDNGTIEIVVNGKAITLPAAAVTAALAYKLTEKALPPLVSFSQKTYPNFDADATAAVNALGIGINYGQVWETMTLSNVNSVGDHVWLPGAYRNLVCTKSMFSLLVAAGFAHIRIPVNFSYPTGIVPPYTIDPGFLNRFFADVDMALDAGLKVIIDHHYFGPNAILTNASAAVTAGEIGSSLTLTQKLDRQAKMVGQVAAYIKYKGYDVNKVFLEIENEPGGEWSSYWQSYYPTAIAACRAAHPMLILLVPGLGGSVSGANAMPLLQDTRTCLTVHPYEPLFEFTHSDYSKTLSVLWTPVLLSTMKASIATAAAVSAKQGRPCIATEFGARIHIPIGHRRMYARDVVNECRANGIIPTFWNTWGDFGIANPGGFFLSGMVNALTGVDESTIYGGIPKTGSGINHMDVSKSIMSHTATIVNSGGETICTFQDDTRFTLTKSPKGSASERLYVAYPFMKGGQRAAPGRKFRIKFTHTPVGSAYKSSVKIELRNQGYIANNYSAKPQQIYSAATPFPLNGWSANSTYVNPDNPQDTQSLTWGDHSVDRWYTYIVPNPVTPTITTSTPDSIFSDESDPVNFVFTFDSVAVGDVMSIFFEWLDL
jgi:endoglucanase